MVSKEQELVAGKLKNAIVELQSLIKDANEKGVSVELGIGGACAVSGLHYRIYTTPIDIESLEQADEPIIVNDGDSSVQLGLHGKGQMEKVNDNPKSSISTDDPIFLGKILDQLESSFQERSIRLKQYVEDLRLGRDRVPGYKRPY